MNNGLTLLILRQTFGFKKSRLSFKINLSNSSSAEIFFSRLFSFYLDLFITFYAAVVLTKLIPNKLIVSINLMFIGAVVLLLFMVTTNIIAVQGISDFDPLCSQPTWKHVTNFLLTCHFQYSCAVTF
jgi:ABC-type bacteriocin/lantibiotic exporter with double-glycine peptidase domain